MPEGHSSEPTKKGPLSEFMSSSGAVAPPPWTAGRPRSGQHSHREHYVDRTAGLLVTQSPQIASKGRTETLAWSVSSPLLYEGCCPGQQHHPPLVPTFSTLCFLVLPAKGSLGCKLKPQCHSLFRQCGRQFRALSSVEKRKLFLRLAKVWVVSRDQSSVPGRVRTCDTPCPSPCANPREAVAFLTLPFHGRWSSRATVFMNTSILPTTMR